MSSRILGQPNNIIKGHYHPLSICCWPRTLDSLGDYDEREISRGSCVDRIGRFYFLNAISFHYQAYHLDQAEHMKILI